MSCLLDQVSGGPRTLDPTARLDQHLLPVLRAPGCGDPAAIVMLSQHLAQGPLSAVSDRQPGWWPCTTKDSPDSWCGGGQCLVPTPPGGEPTGLPWAASWALGTRVQGDTDTKDSLLASPSWIPRISFPGNQMKKTEAGKRNEAGSSNSSSNTVPKPPAMLRININRSVGLLPLNRLCSIRGWRLGN